MNTSSKWEDFYKNTPLEQIPWNSTQADFFAKLLDDKQLGKGTALDLGCGVGKKSIALAKAGFEVTGVDISQTAIKYAKVNARKAGVKVKFIAADATDLSFLENKRFDFILDWANLHGIPETKRSKYISEIIKHTKKESRLLLRCFSNHTFSPSELGFLTSIGIIYMFSIKDIGKLYGEDFKIIKIRRSKPKSLNHRWFEEYLMVRK